MLQKRRPTLRDVAEAAGVHPSTVSRIVSSPTARGRVSAETVARVKLAAETLGYRPNLMAAGLRSQRSHLIGIVITDITNPSFPPFLLAVEDVIRGKGFLPVVVREDKLTADSESLLRQLVDIQLAGLIFASSADPGRVIEVCNDCDLPVVVAFGDDPAGSTDTVQLDESRAIDLLTGHLTGLGHRRIAHIGGPEILFTGRARAAAFRTAVTERGVALADSPVLHAERYSREAGRAACAELLTSRATPTAILCAHDFIALGCLDALSMSGQSCPVDISVTGYGDMPNADLISPPLTTVRFDTKKVGVLAASAILDRIHGETDAPRGMRVAPQLIVRKSTVASRAM